MLWKEGLVHKLKALGLAGNIVNWIQNFLTNRSMKVKIKGTISSQYQLENGTPQGSVLSPILFLLMINDFPTENNKTKTSLFADDSAIWRSGRNLKTICAALQTQIDKISEWCELWGFKLNDTKTVAMLFTKNSYASKTQLPLTLNGKPLETVQNVKFLGLTFDQRLTWDQHITTVVNKCKQKVNLLRCLTGHSWGAGKKSLLKIYRTLIRPKLEYGIEVFHTASNSAIRKLNTVQNTCLRICCGAMKCTPINALLEECGELPLKLRSERALLRYVNKIKSKTGNPANEALTEAWENYYGNYKIGTEPIYNKTKEFLERTAGQTVKAEIKSRPPWLQCDITIDTELRNVISKQVNTQTTKHLATDKIDRYSDHVQVYTDGSKTMTGETGAAFYIPKHDIQKMFKLENHVTVNTAELIAIKEAINHITESDKYSRQKIAIFTDSLNAATALAKTNPLMHENIQTEIIDLAESLAEQEIKIKIIWIPSHVGIEGNDMADKLAKAAVMKSQTDLNLPYSSSENNAEIDKYINQKWQEVYNSIQTGSHYKLIEPNISRGIKYTNTNRWKEVIITRLRLGKCLLNHYKHKIKLHSTGLCDQCNCPETITHFLLECPHSNVLYNRPVTIKEALTKADLIDIIFDRIRELKRKI